MGSARPVGVTTAANQGRVASGAARGNWLTLGKDGRLSLYAPTDGGLLYWTETAVGGPGWSGPHFVAASGLTDLTVTQGADRYVHFFGRRERTGGNGATSVDIVHAIQYQTGLAFADWRSLGNPHKDREHGRALGVPVGAIASDGSVYVFARSADHGLMLRREGPSGKWKPWEDLHGSAIDALPVPVALSGGRIEVCAAAQTGVLLWRQTEAGGGFAAPRGFSLRPLPGTVAVLETGPERATFFWTDSADGFAAAWRPGGWPVPLGESPAEGPYAVLRTALDGYDCVVLACRGQDGAVVLGVGGTENEASGFWWYALAELCQGAPALAQDGRGRVVMALIDPDGVPRVARQEDSAGLALTHWQRL
ncbi:PLL family lectin [Streptomyces sp. SD15]